MSYADLIERMQQKSAKLVSESVERCNFDPWPVPVGTTLFVVSDYYVGDPAKTVNKFIGCPAT